MSALKKKRLPDLGELSRSRQDAEADPLDQLLGHRVPPPAPSPAPPPAASGASSFAASLGRVVPEEEYYLIRKVGRNKGNFQMDQELMYWIEREQRELEAQYVGAAEAGPKLTDYFHAAFFLLKQVWENDPETRDFLEQWMVERRTKMKEIQYAKRAESMKKRRAKKAAAEAAADLPDGVGKNER